MSVSRDDASLHDLDEQGAKTSASWVSSRDAVAFAEHLATLTKSGLPLPSGLRALAAEVPSRKLKATLVETADRLDAGVPLDETIRDRAIAFPVYLRGLILAGTRAGMLADILTQFVRYRSLADELRRRFWISLSYPILLLVAIASLIIFVLIAVVRPFEIIMGDFGISVPTLTMIIFQIEHFLSDFGLMILINLLLGSLILLAAFRLLLSPADRRRVVLGMPVVGNVLRFSTLAEFCHLLATLIDARMPLPEALDLASQAVSDPALAETGAAIRKAIDRGFPLAAALGEWKACPPGLAEILVWAESHRNLPESLHMAGDMFEARARSQSGFAMVLFGTLSLILVVWGVGVVIIALFLPMITLISRLSG